MRRSPEISTTVGLGTVRFICATVDSKSVRLLSKPYGLARAERSKMSRWTSLTASQTCSGEAPTGRAGQPLAKRITSAVAVVRQIRESISLPLRHAVLAPRFFRLRRRHQGRCRRIRLEAFDHLSAKYKRRPK